MRKVLEGFGERERRLGDKEGDKGSRGNSGVVAVADGMGRKVAGLIKGLGVGGQKGNGDRCRD